MVKRVFGAMLAASIWFVGALLVHGMTALVPHDSQAQRARQLKSVATELHKVSSRIESVARDSAPLPSHTKLHISDAKAAIDQASVEINEALTVLSHREADRQSDGG